MDVFDLDRTLVADYASFARSFTEIRAQDIRDQVDEIYASRRVWPEPLITINPHFEQGASVEALVAGCKDFPLWVKGGCRRQAVGTAGLPPAPENVGCALVLLSHKIAHRVFM